MISLSEKIETLRGDLLTQKTELQAAKDRLNLIAFDVEVGDPVATEEAGALRTAIAGLENRLEQLEAAISEGRRRLKNEQDEAAEKRKLEDWQAFDLLDNCDVAARNASDLLKQAGAAFCEVRELIYEAHNKIAGRLDPETALFIRPSEDSLNDAAIGHLLRSANIQPACIVNLSLGNVSSMLREAQLLPVVAHQKARMVRNRPSALTEAETDAAQDSYRKTGDKYGRSRIHAALRGLRGLRSQCNIRESDGFYDLCPALLRPGKATFSVYGRSVRHRKGKADQRLKQPSCPCQSREAGLPQRYSA